MRYARLPPRFLATVLLSARNFFPLHVLSEMSQSADTLAKKESTSDLALPSSGSSLVEVDSTSVLKSDNTKNTENEQGQISKPPSDIENFVSLNQLPSNSQEHIVRLKVVHKFETTQNPGKARFQRIWLSGRKEHTEYVSI